MTERVTRARHLILKLGVCSLLGAPAITWADDPPPPTPPADAPAPAPTADAPSAPPAPAPTADSLLKEGNTLMKSGNLVDACKAFEGSIQLDKKATTVIRLAECREANHQLASAVAAYNDALAIPKVDRKSKKTATAKVAALTPKISTLRFTVPDASALEGLAITRGGEPVAADLWNTKIPVDGGDYAIEVTAPGHLPYKETATVPPEAGEISVKVPVLEVEPPPPPPPPPPPVKVEPPPPPPVVVAPPPEPPSRWSMESLTTITPFRKVAIGVAGFGVVSVTVAIILGAQADGKYDDSRDLCPDLDFPCANAAEANELNDSARNRALGANIMWTVGAAAVVGAGVMWVLGAPSVEEGGVAIAPSITPTDASVALIGRF